MKTRKADAAPAPKPIPVRLAELCQACAEKTNARQVTGFCMHGCCTRCGTVTDIAIVRR